MVPSLLAASQTKFWGVCRCASHRLVTIMTCRPFAMPTGSPPGLPRPQSSPLPTRPQRLVRAHARHGGPAAGDGLHVDAPIARTHTHTQSQTRTPSHTHTHTPSHTGVGQPAPPDGALSPNNNTHTHTHARHHMHTSMQPAPFFHIHKRAHPQSTPPSRNTL